MNRATGYCAILAVAALTACTPITPVPVTPSSVPASSSAVPTSTAEPTSSAPAPTSEPATSVPTPTPTVTSVPPPTTTPTVVPPPTTTPTPPPPGRKYPVHTNIVSTTFWVGEIFDPKLPDGSQVCSTYDSKWALHWSGVQTGTVSAKDPGCPGSPKGGCDGVPGTNKCDTEARHPENGFFPTHTNVVPRENPFYLDLPFDDINDTTGFKTRCATIPWANDPGWAGHCTDQNFSYMKNRWVKITGPAGDVCYGQIEDAGPSSGSKYHDAPYVFGANNVQPGQTDFNRAGLDVSPALNGCLKYAELDGEDDHVSWSFVDAPPPGPWTKLVTTGQVTQ